MMDEGSEKPELSPEERLVFDEFVHSMPPSVMAEWNRWKCGRYWSDLQMAASCVRYLVDDGRLALSDKELLEVELWWESVDASEGCQRETLLHDLRNRPI